MLFQHVTHCRFWGLQTLIPLLQYVNRLGFEICSVNRARKLGYVNLNWPRCSARVTESLALTDGSFCQKQNTLCFRLCNNCEFMMCILIVDHQFNCMHPWCSWECMLPGRCSPGKRCHTFWNTDTIFSDTRAINDGSTMAQFFVGRDTLVCDAYGIKTQRQFINTLYDNIRFRGAMTTLITDGGRYEISKKVADLLRNLFIKQHESEPYHQHQNKAEQRYGVVKRYLNTLMNLTGAPAHCWLLCILYVCHLLNATASPALGGLTPLQALTGQVPDISHFLHFSFWEPIYYKVDESKPDHRFPSQSNEKRGHWVGFAENKGDQLTWKILTDDTNTIIIRSAVRSATKTSPNLRLDPPQGEDQPQDLTSDVFVYGRPNPDGSDTTPPMSIINFDDLLGRTFLLPMDENGERKRATISEHVKDLYQQQVSREDQLRFKLKIDGDQLDDLISYNQLMEYLEDKTDTGPLEDGLYRFKCIKDHKGPYTSSDPEYNGSSYNLLIE